MFSMDTNAGYAALHSLAAILAVSLIWRALWHLVWIPYTVARLFERQGIRGPPYRLGVGSLLEMRRMLVARRAGTPLDPGCHDYTTLAIPFFHKWTSDYGKTFLYWLGHVPAICSTDMELLKQVLNDKTDLFQKDYMNPSFEVIFGKGLLAANGEDWKRHHKVIHPIFKQENLKSVAAMAAEGTRKMIEQWCAQIDKSDCHQAEIDMRCYSEELSLGTIEQVIIGKRYKEAREVFVAGKELQKLALYAFSDPPIPGYRYLPTRRHLRSWKLDKLITTKATRFIEARIASGVYGDDLLGMMLKAHKSEVEVLSIEEIIGECKTIFATGYESGSTLLTWVMFLLSSYPQWQEKIREEVLRECPDVDITDDLGKLKLLNMFLLETLRLYSPVPFFARKAASDTILANIKVPKGTMITFPVVMLHRSKDIWGLDADEFNPMRFEKGVSRAAKHGHAFFTFSYGPRGCIGRNYTMIQVQTMMSMILRRFSFSLSSQYVHMPTNFITLVPRYGLPLIVRNQEDGQKVNI
uniref:Uncharacterized protein n=1 Tax=Avena sativa TaxID=4498 RepID=A0ACD5ZLW2_AVESA